jgi:hypothetical protein
VGLQFENMGDLVVRATETSLVLMNQPKNKAAHEADSTVIFLDLKTGEV